MLIYILFLTIGIIIFILLNQNENFNIGNQFSTALSQIESNTDVACPPEAESCRESLMDSGGACALLQLLKLYAIQGEEITQEELQIIVGIYEKGTSRDDTLEVLNILGNTGKSMMNILHRNDIGRSGIECNLVDLVDIDYKADVKTAHKNLNEYLVINKLYLASINLQFQEGAYPPEPSKVGVGHAFLIYKDINPDKQIVYYIFDGCSPNLDTIVSTDNNADNLNNISSYWITKFGINKEKMISCNIALYIYHNVEAVCTALLALGQSGGGGGYGGLGGSGYGSGSGRYDGPPRNSPDSNGNRDSDLKDELNERIN